MHGKIPPIEQTLVRRTRANSKWLETTEGKGDQDSKRILVYASEK